MAERWFTPLCRTPLGLIQNGPGRDSPDKQLLKRHPVSMSWAVKPAPTGRKHHVSIKTFYQEQQKHRQMRRRFVRHFHNGVKEKRLFDREWAWSSFSLLVVFRWPSGSFAQQYIHTSGQSCHMSLDSLDSCDFIHANHFKIKNHIRQTYATNKDIFLLRSVYKVWQPTREVSGCLNSESKCDVALRLEYIEVTKWPQSVRLHDTWENRITVLVRLWWDFLTHVYTLVWLKSDRIGFLIVGLKHLDYLIDSCITPACICSIRSDRISAFCAGSRFFSRGREPEVEGWRRRWRWWRRRWWRRWRRRCLSSEITARKSANVHLVGVIMIHYIQMYKHVASSRSLYTIFHECRGSLLLLVT